MATVTLDDLQAQIKAMFLVMSTAMARAVPPHEIPTVEARLNKLIVDSQGRPSLAHVHEFARSLRDQCHAESR